MHYIICDLEATCWANERRPERMEVIEIGAVKLASAGGPVLGEFSAFVRPILESTLSDYCRELTSITQADVDGAEPFPVVLERFLAWMEEPPLRFCSWGQYDLNQLRLDCDRHNLVFSIHFADHLNVKNAWAGWKGVKPRGLARALRLMGMELEGRHHRGIDDARNIARIVMAMGEVWEEATGNRWQKGEGRQKMSLDVPSIAATWTWTWAAWLRWLEVSCPIPRCWSV